MCEMALDALRESSSIGPWRPPAWVVTAESPSLDLTYTITLNAAKDASSLPAPSAHTDPQSRRPGRCE